MKQSIWAPACIALFALSGLSTTASAVDGVLLIDQARALAGNVTPGDAPGFPITITRPGSYRLAGNIVVSDITMRAILINAVNVTIDLNGFEIAGPGNCDVGGGGDCTNRGGHGIVSAVGPATVRNGAIRNMGGSGVVCVASCKVDGVTSLANNGDGINAPAYALLIGNRAIANGGLGLNLGAVPYSGYVNNICVDNGIGGVSGGTPLGGNVCAGP